MKYRRLDILALCDREEEYIQSFAEYVKRYKNLPWELHVYTDLEELIRGEENNFISVLIMAESVFGPEWKGLKAGCTVILNESGVIRYPDLKNVDKYQCAENVVKELVEAYAEVAENPLPGLAQGGSAKLVGIYSPVRRCLQTSFALTLSQMLARDSPTLYLNFEHYAGIGGILPDMQVKDLGDLLYFLNGEGDKFSLRMETLIQKKGSLDYIPPMKAGQNLLTVTPQEWRRLLSKIEEMGKYEYIILDLSESIQGLFEIMSRCYKIFTLTQSDKAAEGKLLQYEQLLALYQAEEILQKTSRLCPPRFGRLPEEPEQYTKGELAEYVKEILKEL